MRQGFSYFCRSFCISSHITICFGGTGGATGGMPTGSGIIATDELIASSRISPYTATMSFHEEGCFLEHIEQKKYIMPVICHTG